MAQTDPLQPDFDIRAWMAEVEVMRQNNPNHPLFREMEAISLGYSDCVTPEEKAEQERRGAEQLTQRLTSLSVENRELTIIEAISETLNEPGKRYVLPFRFRPTTKTSHHLIFVSKNILGYTIMKDIMAKESSSAPQGLATFEYNPASQEQPLLFRLAATLDNLGDLLLDEFAGRTMTMREVYEAHQVGRPFVEPNYKQALITLESEGKIVADPPAVAVPPQKARRKGTFGPDVKVMFPPKSRS